MTLFHLCGWVCLLLTITSGENRLGKARQAVQDWIETPRRLVIRNDERSRTSCADLVVQGTGKSIFVISVHNGHAYIFADGKKVPVTEAVALSTMAKVFPLPPATQAKRVEARPNERVSRPSRRTFVPLRHTGGEQRCGLAFPSGPPMDDGVRPACHKNLFLQGKGVFEKTGNPLEVAIEGQGYFQIRNPINGDVFYTRDGSFQVNANGQLVTSDGFLEPAITIPQESMELLIGRDGTVSVVLPGRVRYPCQVGAITLARFINPGGLTPVTFEGNLLAESGASGSAIVNNPGDNGAGMLRQGFREVFDADEVAETPVVRNHQRSRREAPINLFTQGWLHYTGNPLDLAVEGQGFFQIRLPAEESVRYTRDGSFTLNAEGQIITADGFPLEPGITIPQDALAIHIASDGTVTVDLPNDAQKKVGQIQLTRFINPAGLASSPFDGGLLSRSAASGPPMIQTPGVGGAGLLRQAFREMPRSSQRPEKELAKLLQAIEEFNRKTAGSQGFEIRLTPARAASKR